MEIPLTTRQTALFQNTAGAVHTSWSRAEVWNRAEDRKTLDLDVLDVRYAWDLGASIQRSCTIELAGLDSLLPDRSELEYAGTFADTNGIFGDGLFGDPLARELRGALLAGPTEIRLFAVFEYSDGVTDERIMGRYDIATGSYRSSADGGLTVSVTAYDQLRRLNASGYTVPYNVAEGTNVRSAWLAHLAQQMPNTSFTAPSSSFTTPALTFVPGSGNAADHSQAIAYAAGWVIGTDLNGRIVARVPRDPGTGTPDWTIGLDHIIDASVEQGDDDLVNRLTIIGEDDQGAPVYGSAQLNSGPFGVPSSGLRDAFESVDTVTTTAQASAYARARLSAYLGDTDTVRVEITWHPFLDIGMLLEISDEDLQLDNSVYLIERVEHSEADYTTTLTLSRRLVA